MHGKFVKKLTEPIFELRVEHFDRIVRVLYFYQPGMLIVITSGSRRRVRERHRPRSAGPEQLRHLWLKHRNQHKTRVISEK